MMVMEKSFIPDHQKCGKNVLGASGSCVAAAKVGAVVLACSGVVCVTKCKMENGGVAKVVEEMTGIEVGSIHI
ncbi:hypothetical protein ACOSQ3_016493 [Xanthoceras sorbifolium]